MSDSKTPSDDPHKALAACLFRNEPWTAKDEVVWQEMTARRAADLSKFRVPLERVTRKVMSETPEDACVEELAASLEANCHAVVRVLLPFCARTPIPKDLEEMTK